MTQLRVEHKSASEFIPCLSRAPHVCTYQADGLTLPAGGAPADRSAAPSPPLRSAPSSGQHRRRVTAGPAAPAPAARYCSAARCAERHAATEHPDHARRQRSVQQASQGRSGVQEPPRSPTQIRYDAAQISRSATADAAQQFSRSSSAAIHPASPASRAGPPRRRTPPPPDE